jgi:hypothetical protein
VTTALGALAILFVAAAAVWFILVAANHGQVDAGRAFIGLGYISAVVFVLLAVLWGIRLLGGPSPSAPEASDDYWNHRLISTQLWVGALLIALGAVLGLVFGIILSDTGKLPLAIATAVIGAGAALMPPGAAAGAAQRLQDSANNDKASGKGKKGGDDPDAPLLRSVVPERGKAEDEVRVLGRNLLVPAGQERFEPLFVSFGKNQAELVGLREEEHVLVPEDADAQHLPQHKDSGDDSFWVTVPAGLPAAKVSVTARDHTGKPVAGAVDFEVVGQQPPPAPSLLARLKHHRKKAPAPRGA